MPLTRPCPDTGPHPRHPNGIDGSTCPGHPAPVEVGDTVLYWNAFEHPRAAIVTGTRASLQGERHVPIPDYDSVIHLVRFSPLGYAEYLTDVPEWPGRGTKSGHWTRKP